MQKSFILIINILIFCEISFSQQSDYYIIPTQTLNTFELLGLKNKKNYKQTNNSFEISKLITLKEYNEYLEFVKANSTRLFYKTQFPDTAIFLEKDIKKYLKNKNLQNEAIVGISWENAMNFCKWKTLKDNKNGEIKFIYRLPYSSEWLFSQYFLQKTETENDFNQKYSDWLLNTKDETVSSFYHDFVDYSYFAFDGDPNALKRKIIIGNSYLFKQPTFADFFNLNYYSFEGYPQNCFRCIKVYLNDSTIANTESAENKIIKLWNIDLPKTSNKNTTKTTFIKDSIFISYQLDNNLFNGFYFSKYKNGLIKSTGYFVDNMKVGIWCVYDSLGILKNQRFYYNN